MRKPLEYIFGPVRSWRLGMSLGVDPLSSKSKICNMDCIYCQLGKTDQLINQRKIYVPTQDVMEEISCVSLHRVDHITFAGRGEPTLALNLGEMIRGIKSIRHEKIAVLTNSALMNHQEVRDDLSLADVVVAKLDAGNQSFFETMDQGQGLNLEEIIQGIKVFRSGFNGKLALQIMLVDQNIQNIGQIADVCKDLGADEIQLDTPLRPSAITPLDRQGLLAAKKFFKGMSVISVFDAPLEDYTPMDEQATINRHGNYRKTAKKS